MGDDLTATGMPRVEAAWRLTADIWEFGVELALVGIMQQDKVSREDAVRMLADRIREEVRRDSAAMLRVAKALHG